MRLASSRYLSSNPTCISVMLWLHSMVSAGWKVGQEVVFVVLVVIVRRSQADELQKVDPVDQSK